MIDFDPSKYLTLTPAVGEETVFTVWVCPDASEISKAFMENPEPVEAMECAKSIAIEAFERKLQTVAAKIIAGFFSVSRAWIGEPRRDHVRWDNPFIHYPVRLAAHSIQPEFGGAALLESWSRRWHFEQSPLAPDADPNTDPTSLMTEAIDLLRRGDYEHGLPLYEFRHQTPQGHKQWKDFLTMPHWDGRTFEFAGDYPGGTRKVKLLIHAEQGYGDTIQFARYLPWLNDIDADFMVPPCLIELMKTLNFKGRVSDKLDIEKPYDFHVPVCSLALALDPKMQETPRSPYLTSDREKYWHWRDRTGREGYKVGICWTGSRIHQENNQRSRTIEQVINACPKDARLFNLQKGEGREQLKLLPTEIVVEDFSDELHDFSDTAAFIDNLDLIVTVDTAMAHLAGALGRPVKLLTGPNAEWRWGEDSDRTRWYSSMVIDRTEA